MSTLVVQIFVYNLFRIDQIGLFLGPMMPERDLASIALRKWIQNYIVEKYVNECP